MRLAVLVVGMLRVSARVDVYGHQHLYSLHTGLCVCLREMPTQSLLAGPAGTELQQPHFCQAARFSNSLAGHNQL